MLKKCLYLYAMFIFCVTAVEACDDEVKDQFLSCGRCKNRRQPVSNGEDVKIEDDNQELEEISFYAYQEDRSNNRTVV